MLSFQFDNVQDVFTMSGHGGYVWSSWAISLLIIFGLIIYARYERRNALKQIRLQQARC